jgi:hypothetical protein
MSGKSKELEVGSYETTKRSLDAEARKEGWLLSPEEDRALCPECVKKGMTL